MPNLPIRGLGAVGVVTDVDPYNLPIGGFTRAKNVRFTEGKVTHGPVYREVSASVTSEPVFAHGVFANSGYDSVVLVDNAFNVSEFVDGAIAAESRYSGVDSDSTANVTATSLADVQYLNRADETPIARTPDVTDGAFSELANWPNGDSTDTSTFVQNNTWTTAVLRSYGDFLLALNTTENSTNYPNRVRFSDPALANSVPATWDDTDTTKSAGFTDLVQMGTPIIDGATLGPNFLIYSQDQVWMMEFVGGTFIFNFRKVFSDAGVISANCIAEVEGQHFVFDRDDIYVTDGNSRQSICEGKVRDYIFSGIDLNKDSMCFVMHNPVLEEVYFCYHSGDDMAEFAEGDACNRAAVYNYRDQTWTFQDLPNVVAGTNANVTPTTGYNNTSTSYNDIGGSYHSLESGFQRHPLMYARQYTYNSENYSESRLLGLDLVDQGALPQAISTDLSKPAFLERVGIDMDEQGISLAGYKVVNKILPQISTPNANGDFDFTFGAANTPNGTPNYGASVTFDALTDYKLDTRISGRYLSYKLATDTLKDFAFSGMDVELVVTGRR